ncbi:hypothetical protein K469DRAFT_510450, partial [Zopfia rhizophila CBS 207.26]
ASRIRNEPRHMPSPCSRCRDNGRQCLVRLSSGRCSECINRNTKCDLILEKTQDNLLNHCRREEELRAHERCLHQELAQTDSREKEMFQRELALID